MRRSLLVVVIVIAAIAAYVGYVRQHSPVSEIPAPGTAQNESVLASAFRNHERNIQVQGQGQVTKILADDNDGNRHQRFIVRVGSGQTLLIAHNVDLAPRITSLSLGDTIEFNGQYEWNPQGGVVHWTHRDPSGRHQAGWLRHNGQTSQ